MNEKLKLLLPYYNTISIFILPLPLLVLNKSIILHSFVLSPLKCLGPWNSLVGFGEIFKIQNFFRPRREDDPTVLVGSTRPPHVCIHVGATSSGRGRERKLPFLIFTFGEERHWRHVSNTRESFCSSAIILLLFFGLCWIVRDTPLCLLSRERQKREGAARFGRFMTN